ncbi:META domain-containing protein [Leucobacter celer]|uniref:META domain-containing protein n=1 Tax=Leucobacter celer TaxID=668625 RepID=UPI0006A7A78F|nr:META domain-containing protein [Leucobacter celer]
MSTLTHTLCIFGAGVLAFGAVFASHQLTAPLVEPTPAHDSGQEDAVDDHTADEDLEELPVVPGPTGDPSEALLEQAILGRWQAPEPANQDAFVEFTQYGLWFASDGCNGLNGTWSATEDGDLSIDGTEAMTMIACDNEPIPTAVRYAVSAEVTPDWELVLTDADGEQTTLVQARHGSISLAGRWVPEQSTGGAYVEFALTGRWESSDGCNTATGSWELSAVGSDADSATDDVSALNPTWGRLVVGDLSGMTRMACEDLDSVNLPLMLADATGLDFIDQNRVMILIAEPGSSAEEWQSVLLQRADEGAPVIVAP